MTLFLFPRSLTVNSNFNWFQDDYQLILHVMLFQHKAFVGIWHKKTSLQPALSNFYSCHTIAYKMDSFSQVHVHMYKCVNSTCYRYHRSWKERRGQHFQRPCSIFLCTLHRSQFLNCHVNNTSNHSKNYDNYIIYQRYKKESLRLTSGAMYSTVPQNEYVFWSYSDSFERPKSKKKKHVIKQTIAVY